jgi:hypothetical protein
MTQQVAAMQAVLTTGSMAHWLASAPDISTVLPL